MALRFSLRCPLIVLVLLCVVFVAQVPLRALAESPNPPAGIELAKDVFVAAAAASVPAAEPPPSPDGILDSAALPRAAARLTDPFTILRI